MAKPAGPSCNLDCRYCFYTEKKQLFRPDGTYRMSDAVLEAYISQYIQAQDLPVVDFAWQGGEPTTLGINFFRKVLALQCKHARGKKITNAIQTNGVLLDDAWCDFLTRNSFLVGVSIDGPRELHDCYRVDKAGRPTFDQVMAGVECMRKHKTAFNTLTVVHRQNAYYPLEVYRFLKTVGGQVMQFIPLVEREPDLSAQRLGFKLSGPPVPGTRKQPPVTAWSVRPEPYGEFLKAIFDEWVRRDVGRFFVQMFDVSLANWMKAGSSLCLFAEECGRAMVLEHNGDLYACDHYVSPDYRLGNILHQPISELANSSQQRRFGSRKRTALPQYCVDCEVRFACNGGCPKRRFATSPRGEPGLNYLCAGYRSFFNHVDESMRTMAHYLRWGQPAALIMDRVRQDDLQERLKSTRRNAPCPCGSGKKFRKCCGRKRSRG